MARKVQIEGFDEDLLGELQRLNASPRSGTVGDTRVVVMTCK